MKPYADIFTIARQSQRAPRNEPMQTLVGSEIIAFYRRATEGMQPRTMPGRRAEDKIDLAQICAQLLESKESIAKLMDAAHVLIEELQAERKEHHTTRSALTLTEALLNRERGFDVPITAGGSDVPAHS